MIPATDRDDIRAFVGRDWAAIADAKARFWTKRKRAMSAEEALAVAETLRRHANSLKPGWPDPAERVADLALHVRMSEALRAVLAREPR